MKENLDTEELKEAAREMRRLYALEQEAINARNERLKTGTKTLDAIEDATGTGE